MNAPPQQYVMLNQGGSNPPPPPFRRSIPPYNHPSHRRKGSCCLRCICCCCCLIFLVILVLFGAVFYIYNVYSPKKPDYKLQDLDVKAFDLGKTDATVHTEIVVVVKAVNPNSNIALIYGKDSSVVVYHESTALCSGKLPAFRQGHLNTTLMKVTMKGKAKMGPGLQDAIMKSQMGGTLPLLVRVQVPVGIVLGDFPLRTLMVYANCSLVVQDLAPNKKANIKESKYKFDFAF